MTDRLTRRMLLAAGPAVFACCGHEGPYFGATTPPGRQQLVYANGNEPDIFDPATYAGGTEMRIINALFDGLTKFHPVSLAPMAALATHYEANADATRFTFYLRGHPHPRGMRFPNTDDLPAEFSRGHKAPPDSAPARWSDGGFITASDFVYSWRRVVEPRTASADAGYFYCIENAEAIHHGKLPPERLGVAAEDDFTFEVHLRAPTAHFLALQSQRVFFPVPRQAIEARADWGRVVSGAFQLHEWRHNEEVVLVRNPGYYEAEVVALEKIVFLPVKHDLLANLYRAGGVDATDGAYMRPQFIRVLSGKRDFHSTPILERADYAINVRQRPFDNVLLRYALNMATDKKAIVSALESGDLPAQCYVPPMQRYEQVTSLPVRVDGLSFDVLCFDPEAARALLAKAGFVGGLGPEGRRLSFELTFSGARTVPEILQQQWRANLNVDVKLQPREFVIWIRELPDLNYRGVCEDYWTGKYPDPATFLDMFHSGSVQSGTGWSDSKFDSLLAAADTARDPATRMLCVAECEKFLLGAMPIIPMYFKVYSSLVKPYMRGWESNALNEQHFKYAWIDTHWRPS